MSSTALTSTNTEYAFIKNSWVQKSQLFSRTSCCSQEQSGTTVTNTPDDPEDEPHCSTGRPFLSHRRMVQSSLQSCCISTQGDNSVHQWTTLNPLKCHFSPQVWCKPVKSLVLYHLPIPLISTTYSSSQVQHTCITACARKVMLLNQAPTPQELTLQVVYTLPLCALT